MKSKASSASSFSKKRLMHIKKEDLVTMYLNLNKIMMFELVVGEVSLGVLKMAECFSKNRLLQIDKRDLVTMYLNLNKMFFVCFYNASISTYDTKKRTTDLVRRKNKTIKYNSGEAASPEEYSPGNSLERERRVSFKDRYYYSNRMNNISSDVKFIRRRDSIRRENGRRRSKSVGKIEEIDKDEQINSSTEGIKRLTRQIITLERRRNELVITLENKLEELLNSLHFERMGLYTKVCEPPSYCGGGAAFKRSKTITSASSEMGFRRVDASAREEKSLVRANNSSRVQYITSKSIKSLGDDSSSSDDQSESSFETITATKHLKTIETVTSSCDVIPLEYHHESTLERISARKHRKTSSSKFIQRTFDWLGVRIRNISHLRDKLKLKKGKHDRKDVELSQHVYDVCYKLWKDGEIKRMWKNHGIVYLQLNAEDEDRFVFRHLENL